MAHSIGKTLDFELGEATESIWQIAFTQLKNNALWIELPDNIANLIGIGGLKGIMMRLSHFVRGNVVLCHDQNKKTLVISPYCNPSVQGLYPAHLHTLSELNSFDSPTESNEKYLTSQFQVNMNTTTSRRSKATVPRPPNAFILYRQHHHPIVKAANPDLHNNEISLIIGRQWKFESEEIKNEFRQKSTEMKQKHLEKYPDYQYRPRKPSEKPRRMTKRKALATAEAKSASWLNNHVSLAGSENARTKPEPSPPEFNVSVDGSYCLTRLCPGQDPDVVARLISQHNASEGIDITEEPDLDNQPPILVSWPTAEAVECTRSLESSYDLTTLLDRASTSEDLAIAVNARSPLSVLIAPRVCLQAAAKVTSALDGNLPKPYEIEYAAAARMDELEEELFGFTPEKPGDGLTEYFASDVASYDINSAFDFSEYGW